MNHPSRLTADLAQVRTDEPELEFVAATETLDRQRSVLRLAGLDTAKYLRNPVVVDCHNYSSVAFVLGHVVKLAIRDGRLVNRVRLCLDNPLGRLAYQLARKGHLRAQSVGFMPLQFRTLADDVLEIQRAELLEISLVVVPANPDAVAPAPAVGQRTAAPDALERLARLLENRAAGESAFDRLARHLAGGHPPVLAARVWNGPAGVTPRAQTRRGLSPYSA